MGYNWSQSETRTVAADLRTQWAAILGSTTRFELRSLEMHMTDIRTEKSSLTTVLGLQNLSGTATLFRMAESLAFQDFDKNALIAIGWFNGRLPTALNIDDYSWHKQLFDAVSTVSLGTEKLIAYKELCDLVSILLSAYDWNPTDFTNVAILPLDPQLSDQLLSAFKSPAVRFAQFDQILRKYPFLLLSLANIWNRLLVDAQSIYPSQGRAPEKPEQLQTSLETALSRGELAALFAALGPGVVNWSILFRASRDGYSMKAFEATVMEWSSSVFILIEGRTSKNRNQTSQSQKGAVDEIMTIGAGSTAPYLGPIKIGIVVREAWKKNHNTGFGGSDCKLVMFLPSATFLNLPANPVFFDPSRGIGFGMGLRAPMQAQQDGSTRLTVDRSMQHGVLQSPYHAETRDYITRFHLDDISAWAV